MQWLPELLELLYELIAAVLQQNTDVSVYHQ